MNSEENKRFLSTIPQEAYHLHLLKGQIRNQIQASASSQREFHKQEGSLLMMNLLIKLVRNNWVLLLIQLIQKATPLKDIHKVLLLVKDSDMKKWLVMVRKLAFKS